MPVVPAFQVLPGGGGGPRLASTIGNEAAAAGQRVQKAGQQLFDQGVKVLDAVDEARALEADVQVSNAINGILTDPENGYLATRGGNAVDQAQAVQEQLRKAIDDAGAKLKNPRQQFLFSKAAEARFSSAIQRVNSHAAQQAEEYKADMLSARAASFVQEAAANPFDANVIATRTGALKQTVQQMAAMRGWSPEQAQAETIKATTNLHGAVLQSMIAQERGSDARAYMASHLDEIDPTKREVFEKVVKQAGIKSDSLNLSLMIDDEGGSLTEKRAKLRKMHDAGQISADLFDATDQRLRDAEGLRKAQEQETRLSTMGAAQEWFLKHPGASPLSMPAPLYAAMKDMGQLDAAYSMSRWGRDGGGADDETKASVYLALSQEVAANPEGFARSFDPRKFVGVLSPTQIESLQKDAREGVLGDFTEGVKLISGELVAQGLDPSPTLNPTAKADNQENAKANARRWAMFTNAYRDQIAATRQDLKRRLTQEELRSLGLAMLADVTLKTRYQDKSIFGGTRPATMAASGKLYQFLGNNDTPIAPVTRAGIVATLKGQGVANPTEAQVRAELRRRALLAAAAGGAEK